MAIYEVTAKVNTLSIVPKGLKVTINSKNNGSFPTDTEIRDAYSNAVGKPISTGIAIQKQQFEIKKL